MMNFLHEILKWIESEIAKIHTRLTALENGDTPPEVTPQPAPTPPIEAQPQPVKNFNPFKGVSFYVDPNSNAANWVKQNPNDPNVQYIEKIAKQPQAFWLGAWSGNVKTTVQTILSNAQEQLVVFVVYNIPNRDNGSYSAGGSPSFQAYKNFIDAIKDGMAGFNPVFVIEPDALAGEDGYSQQELNNRNECLRYAIDTLTDAGGYCYLDMGNYSWKDAATMVNRYQALGTTKNHGFSLNVSGYGDQVKTAEFADNLVVLTGKPSIIDTSRNGNGPTPDNQWCNPRDRALGFEPQAIGTENIDAYFWIKRPGESDGECNGGPSAGTFWPEIAIELSKNAKY